MQVVDGEKSFGGFFLLSSYTFTGKKRILTKQLKLLKIKTKQNNPSTHLRDQSSVNS